MSNTNTNDAFAQWRSKQPRKLFRVFYKDNTFDVLAHSESDLHEQMRRVLPHYQQQLAKITQTNV